MDSFPCNVVSCLPPHQFHPSPTPPGGLGSRGVINLQGEAPSTPPKSPDPKPCPERPPLRSRRRCQGPCPPARGQEEGGGLPALRGSTGKGGDPHTRHPRHPRCRGAGGRGEEPAGLAQRRVVTPPTVAPGSSCASPARCFLGRAGRLPRAISARWGQIKATGPYLSLPGPQITGLPAPSPQPAFPRRRPPLLKASGGALSDTLHHRRPFVNDAQNPLRLGCGGGARRPYLQAWRKRKRVSLGYPRSFFLFFSFSEVRGRVCKHRVLGTGVESFFKYMYLYIYY